MPEPRRAVVGHRPEPPAHESAPPRLSPEEVRALLAVSATNRPASPWPSVAKRATAGLSVVSLLWWTLQSMLGWWSLPLFAAPALYWTLRPFWRQRRDAWV